MFKPFDNLIWKIIGEKEFCSFKKNDKIANFCKNDHNITGICSQMSCPLSNRKYATIIEQEGIFFLLKKEENNFNLSNTIFSWL